MFSKTSPVLIAVCGGTASGKTTFCEVISSNPNFQKVTLISQDSFYRNLTEEENQNVSKFNFDSPDAFDWELIEKTMKRIQKRKPIKIPEYSFITNNRTGKFTEIEVGDVVMFEGLYPFYNYKNINMADYFDLKIFVETDDDVRLGRRIMRDMKSRGRSLESILYQYNTFVKPAYDQWIAPQSKLADVIIPWSEISNNSLSQVEMERINEYPVVKMITRFISQFLDTRNYSKVIRSGSAEMLEGLDVKETSQSDPEN